MKSVIKTSLGNWVPHAEVICMTHRQYQFLRQFRNQPHMQKGDLSRMAESMGFPAKDATRVARQLRKKFNCPSNRQLIGIAQEIFGKNNSVPTEPVVRTPLRWKAATIARESRAKVQEDIKQKFQSLGATVRVIGNNETIHIRLKGATALAWAGTGRWRLKPKKADIFSAPIVGLDKLLAFFNPETP